MINASGNVVFTKKEIGEIAAAVGIDPGEVNKLKPNEFIKEPGRRGRPAAAFSAETVRGLLENRRKMRAAAVAEALSKIE